MAIHTRSGTPFFALPGEIRETIYAYYLTFHFRDVKLSGRPCSRYSGDVIFSRPPPALMLSCKQAYHEMCPAAHVEAVIIPCISNGSMEMTGYAVHGILRISRLRKLVFLVAMEHADWSKWMGPLSLVTGRAKGLRELVVEWALGWATMPGGNRGLGPESRKVKWLSEVIAKAPALEVVTIYGDFSSEWLNELRVMTANKLDRVVKVRCSKGRWWMEGRDDLGMQQLTGQAQ